MMPDTHLPVPPVAVPPVVLPKPRVWPVFVVYVAAAIAVVMAVAVWTVGLAISTRGSVRPADVEAVTQSAAGLLGSLVLTMLVISVAALAGARLSPVPWRERLRVGATRVTLPGLVLFTAGTLGIGFVLQGLTGLGWLPTSPVLEQIDALIQGLSPAGLVAALVVIGILPGICEELLFRGYIQTRLRQRWGTRWAIGVTAVLFGIMHFDLVHSTFAVGIGIWLGHLTERTGSIRPAMVCHAANNAISTLLSATGWYLTSTISNGAMLAGGMMAIAGAAWYLRSCGRRDPQGAAPSAPVPEMATLERRPPPIVL